jgi:hypothetical protein
LSAQIELVTFCIETPQRLLRVMAGLPSEEAAVEATRMVLEESTFAAGIGQDGLFRSEVVDWASRLPWNQTRAGSRVEVRLLTHGLIQDPIARRARARLDTAAEIVDAARRAFKSAFHGGRSPQPRRMPNAADEFQRVCELAARNDPWSDCDPRDPLGGLVQHLVQVRHGLDHFLRRDAGAVGVLVATAA